MTTMIDAGLEIEICSRDVGIVAGGEGEVVVLGVTAMSLLCSSRADGRRARALHRRRRNLRLT